MVGAILIFVVYTINFHIQFFVERAELIMLGGLVKAKLPVIITTSRTAPECSGGIMNADGGSITSGSETCSFRK